MGHNYHMHVKKWLTMLFALFLTFVLSVSLGYPSVAFAASADGSLTALQQAYQAAKAKSVALSAQIVQMGDQQSTLSTQLYQSEEEMRSRLQVQAYAQALWNLRQQRALQDTALAQAAILREQQAIIHLRAQLRFWYEEGTVPYVSVILGAHSFSDLLFRVTAIAQLLARQGAIVEADKQLIAHADLLVTVARQEVQQASRASRMASAATADVAAEQAHLHSLFAKASASRMAAAKGRAAQLFAMQRLASQIAAIELAQARAAAAAKAAALRAAEQARARAAAAVAAKAAAKAKALGKTVTQTVVATPPPAPVQSQGISAATLQTDLRQAISDTGEPASWIPWLSLLVQYESGGNPTAVSPIAVDGEYASGLLQMLPDTFNRYAMSGYDNIWNPVDNAIAAIRYISANYGNPWSIPGIGSESTYRGY